MDSPTKEPSSPGTDISSGKPVDAGKTTIPAPRSWGVASDSIEQPEPPSGKSGTSPGGTAGSAERDTPEFAATRPFGSSVIEADSPDSGVGAATNETTRSPRPRTSTEPPAATTSPALGTSPDPTAPAAAEAGKPAKPEPGAAAGAQATTARAAAGADAAPDGNAHAGASAKPDTTAPAGTSAKPDTAGAGQNAKPAGTTAGAAASGLTAGSTTGTAEATGRGRDGDPGDGTPGSGGDLGATKTGLPAVKEPALAGSAAFGLARLTRRRLRPPATPRHAAVPLNPLLRRFPAVHGMAQRSLDGAAAWRRGRWGRLTLPGLLLLALLGAAGTAGGVLVPATAGNRATDPPPAATPTPGAADTALPVPATDVPLPPLVTDLPVAPTGSATPAAPVPGARPADALAAWAQQVGAKVDIPPVAMQAYGYAEWVVGQRQPNCHLNWTTLAAIGRVESNHGRANGAALLPDGESNPPIHGLPLDGQGDRKLIPDTDQGRLDGDTTYDRAIGSMQFIPTTWALWKVDADNDGVTDPNDIDDAALAAGNYLCANDKDLSTTEDWWNAILTYNNVEPYAQSVYEAANDFGVRSQT
ncbi:hypothetical protein J2S43_006487 [Catenuloplanes nepalensis]|uniref:Transglycosylase SLT domain-containing protein n=1 Tax=Catenuloplanes nepalensis TaxID=587533 RepID=A0ABT9N2Q0_9ACTN|nr:lytic murein transglycosylase [Catenuloplanes nepalensis]MDP9797975.1 hypothetical protein [Catenuloplanes nepalensis]